MDIVIDESFWEIFPDAQINIMVLTGLDNHNSDDQKYVKLLKNAEKEAQKYITDEAFSNNTVVASWRETYQHFKKKKGARSSIEALLKRVAQDKGVGSINPLVDIYNSVSLTYAVPVGGEDLDSIKGDFHLGVAKGGEPFYPLGDDKGDPALSGEIIYYDDQGAICRCLNWRDGQRTMLTEDTKNAIMVMEATNEEQQKNLDKAMNALQELVAKNLNSVGKIYQLTKERQSVTNVF